MHSQLDCFQKGISHQLSRCGICGQKMSLTTRSTPQPCMATGDVTQWQLHPASFSNACVPTMFISAAKFSFAIKDFVGFLLTFDRFIILILKTMLHIIFSFQQLKATIQCNEKILTQKVHLRNSKLLTSSCLWLG